MKRFSAILLLSVTLFAQTELHQLFNLQLLFQHFAEHKQEKKDISVVDFIILHYFSGNPKDKDYEKDMQLPFKTADCAYAVTIAIIPAQVTNETEPVVFTNITYSALKNNIIPSSHSADIWQPPKVS
ncbi:hypothetical protein [Ferruginibacter sp.]|nr:hypothetical protein [Ferruginibacter sp.]